MRERFEGVEGVRELRDDTPYLLGADRIANPRCSCGNDLIVRAPGSDSAACDACGAAWPSQPLERCSDPVLAELERMVRSRAAMERRYRETDKEALQRRRPSPNADGPARLRERIEEAQQHEADCAALLARIQAARSRRTR
jgi:hypothetical protein